MDALAARAPRPARPRLRHALLVGGCLLLAAAPSVAALAPGAAETPRGLLWSVERNGERGYLLGSLHFYRPDLYPLPPPVEAAYREATVVVFEADPAGLESPSFQARVAARGLLGEGEALSDRLPAEDFERLALHASELGVPLAGLERMRPWFAAVTLAGLEMLRLGLDPTQGMDRILHRRAAGDGKRTVYLEDLDFQVELFAGLGEEEAVELLRQSLDEATALDGRIDGLLDAWVTGDRDSLTELVVGALEPYPAVRERFLDERNEAWIPGIRDTLAAGEPVLVVVGAGHLLGDGSLVELLRRDGYRVEPR